MYNRVRVEKSEDIISLSLSLSSDGNNVVDFTYVENVTHAHLLAAKSLHIDSITCGQVSLFSILHYLMSPPPLPPLLGL